MVLYILRRTAVAAAEIKVVWHGSAGTRYDAGVGDGWPNRQNSTLQET